MSNESVKSTKRVLEPYDRVSEVLFGLIMVLTFTGSLSIAQAGPEDIRTMLIGALGCNLAWGIIDGVLYLMGCLAEKGKGLLTLRAVRRATDPQKAQRLIAGALPPLVSSILKPGNWKPCANVSKICRSRPSGHGWAPMNGSGRSACSCWSSCPPSRW